MPDGSDDDDGEGDVDDNRGEIMRRTIRVK